MKKIVDGLVRWDDTLYYFDDDFEERYEDYIKEINLNGGVGGSLSGMPLINVESFILGMGYIEVESKTHGTLHYPYVGGKKGENKIIHYSEGDVEDIIQNRLRNLSKFIPHPSVDYQAILNRLNRLNNI